MPDSGLIQALLDKFKRVGYDTRIGPMGSFTVQDEAGKDNPMTTGNLVPGFPGVVHRPARELTPEEVDHEGMHVLGGAPGAFGGQLAANLLGVNESAGYMAPDEVLAYLTQRASPATTEDAKTLSSIAQTGQGNPLYRALVDKLAQWKRVQ